MKALLILIWWGQFLYIGKIEANSQLLQNQNLCDDVIDLTKLIDFPYKNKCLQIVLNDRLVPCLSKIVGSNLVSLQIRSFTMLKDRDISAEAQEYCQTFLIFVESINDIKRTFESEQNGKKQFFPFTKIYFAITGNNSQDSDMTKADSMAVVKNFLTKNALFGYVFEFTKDKMGFYQVIIKDLLTNDLKQSISSYTPSDLHHPIVDTHLAKDNFRISLFNCEPFTFYREDVSDSTIINEMDGTEYRFVKEVTKNWKKTYNFRDFSRTKISPYSLVINDLSNQSSDLAMCSIWLLRKYYIHYDLTTFYDHVCNTFLVPKPQKLNESSAIYTALKTSVWLLLLFFFLLTAILITFTSKLEKLLYRRESHYLEFTRAVLETINIATSHSVHRFPNGQVAVKIILVSWILLSMWLGISYTTIYSSTLTSPYYEKPVNSVKQFVKRGLNLCSPYLYQDSIEDFRSSVNKDYRKLSTRSLVYGQDLIYKRQLLADNKCGMFATRIMRKYVTFRYVDADMIHTLRIMRECVSLYYTVFAFQKFTPFAKLFNWHIRRYQEYGIIQKWYIDSSKNQQGIEPIFEDHPQHDFRRQINLVNVSGAFYLLFIGLLISIVSFFIEFIQKM